MALLLYHIFLGVYTGAIRLAALWNPKARRWVRGRRGWRQQVAALAAQPQPTIWMHCASYGEFEQGRPVLEALRQRYPHHRFVLTFFSPSGYEACKHYAGADNILYLPMDGVVTAKQFVTALNPTLVLWIKYDYWFYYLRQLRLQKVPVLLVSGIFRPGQPFFKSWGGLWRRMLGCFTAMFVQTEAAAGLLKDIGFSDTVIVGGDTRFDRVLAIAKQMAEIPGIADFCANQPVVVAGSTWEEDEAELVHYARANTNVKFIIAPHEVDADNLQDVKKTFTGSLYYSELREGKKPASNVLIIDNVGMLSKLYRYGTVCYVGGGFGDDGVHNVLEAAVYGKPVIFGPEYDKYIEAIELTEAGGAFSIEHALAFEKLLNELLLDTEALRQAGNAAANYVQQKAGATNAILHYVAEKRLLTN